MVITDHTTAVVRSVTKGKGRASVSSQAEFKTSLDRMNREHVELVQACQSKNASELDKHHGESTDALSPFWTMLPSFLPDAPIVRSIVGDGRLYRLDLAIQYAEVKAVFERLNLTISDKDIKGILMQAKEIRVLEGDDRKTGQRATWICLESAARAADAKKKGKTGGAAETRSPSVNTSFNGSGNGNGTYKGKERERTDSVDVMRHGRTYPDASTGAGSSRRVAGPDAPPVSPWAMQKPEKSARGDKLDLASATKSSGSKLSEAARSQGMRPAHEGGNRRHSMPAFPNLNRPAPRTDVESSSSRRKSTLAERVDEAQAVDNAVGDDDLFGPSDSASDAEADVDAIRSQYDDTRAPSASAAASAMNRRPCPPVNPKQVLEELVFGKGRSKSPIPFGKGRSNSPISICDSASGSDGERALFREDSMTPEPDLQLPPALSGGSDGTEPQRKARINGTGATGQSSVVSAAAADPIMQKLPPDDHASGVDDYGNDYQPDADMTLRADPAPLDASAPAQPQEYQILVDSSDGESAADVAEKLERTKHARRFSMSASSRRLRQVPDDVAAMDIDDEVPGGLDEDDVQLIGEIASGSGAAHPRAERMPAPLLDGFRPARSGGTGPPGMTLKNSRDSSAVDDEDEEDGDVERMHVSSVALDADDGDDLEEEIARARKGGPTRPRGKSSRPLSRNATDDSDDEDVVYVTAGRAGASPPRPRKSKEQREAEREARRREKEVEREKRRSARRKKALPSFRNTADEEDAELLAAYERRKERLGGIAVADEESAWKLFETYEGPRGRANRPDWNSVKFWPYNMPFPGRQEGEAIVAIAGGCSVRCFKLSPTTGVTELWNAVDESTSWSKDEDREVFQALAWTHEERKESSIAPVWRRWPVLLLGGDSKELKVLDGYTGTTMKIVQGHGFGITSIAVHPSLPHVVATASQDESICLWDISVPISKPETLGKSANSLEEDKRRKGYTQGERLCIFGGVGGHLEAVVSIAMHPTLPLLVSGGIDCKLRIWRLPDDLPRYPTSYLFRPVAIPPPKESHRPPTITYPVFTHESLHSHHIDHVSWIGKRGHLLTRSLCFDSPGKRVVRVFRPTFFDTFADPSAKARDVFGHHIEYPAEVEMLARWTVAAASESIGDGVICEDVSLAWEQPAEGRGAPRPVARRTLFFPTVEPAVHSFPIHLDKRQVNVDQLKQTYAIDLGEDILVEPEKRKGGQLRAIDCQSAGSGWLIAVGEHEKLMVWRKTDQIDIEAVSAFIDGGAAGEESQEEERVDQEDQGPRQRQGQESNPYGADDDEDDEDEPPLGNRAERQDAAQTEGDEEMAELDRMTYEDAAPL